MTFAHWRQLPCSLCAGVCDYDQIWSLAGRVAQAAKAMPNFLFFYVTEQKSAVLCTYRIIKLYNNTTYNMYIICHIIYILLYLYNIICILFILYIFIFNCSGNMAKLCTIVL